MYVCISYENSSEHSKSDNLLDENCSYDEFIFNIVNAQYDGSIN